MESFEWMDTERGEIPGSRFLFHHGMPLERVRFGVVNPPEVILDHLEGEDRERAEENSVFYTWLEKQVGFKPLFVSVGKGASAINATAYGEQWWRSVEGVAKNTVLFSFLESPSGAVFMDSDKWMEHGMNMASFGEPTGRKLEEIFQPGWSREVWMKYAANKNNHVELVVPKLDLATANRVWVRDGVTRNKLLGMGFENVLTKRW